EKRLVGWINKKSDEKKIAIPENFEQSTEMAFSGIHVVSPEIFDLMPAEENFSITNFYLDLAKNHLIKGYFDESEIWMDVGKPEELAEVRKLFQ
ncbi:MAG: nucleotidyltransferase family protein, partial [Bacteroidales bacterium]|nr:nucleotidyltransferase family protein [Bacteroidales bacterium]